VSSLFISDLHLVGERPAITDLFLHFTKTIAPRAQALYILGDLFEYWIGDDNTDDTLAAVVADTLKRLSSSGVKVFLMQGNRDVLLGPGFADQSGAELIDDPTLINLYGRPTLLTHGDALCIEDIEYQKFREYARSPMHQQQFLTQSLETRRERMLQMRAQSEMSKQQKDLEIMDVTTSAVDQLLRNHHYPNIIHGHTHRPARHEHDVDSHRCERWVLTDWYQTGGYLLCDASGCYSHKLSQ
jgi:UDP-2,3-diacylglucosamine hydrolase